MGGLKVEDVLALFGRFGENWPSPLTIDLIGGSALATVGHCGIYRWMYSL